MKYPVITIFALLAILVIQCKNNRQTQTIAVQQETQAEPYGYYSDYFVFVADDGGSPLVVPIDINWNPNPDGYTIEYKAWHGTAEDWPIHYSKKDITSDWKDIPNEAYYHSSTEEFQFNSENKSVIARIEGAPEIEIRIPSKEQWVLAPLNSDIYDTYAFKTSIRIGDSNRSGWMLYERIRKEKDSATEFKGFAAFFWMPMILEGELFHFIEHRDELAAVKWTQSTDGIQVETAPDFELTVVETIADTKSKRTDIPKIVQIKAQKWNFDIQLRSSGEQVGYGNEFPKGLGFYRQSLLQSTNDSNSSGYGMMELILEND